VRTGAGAVYEFIGTPRGPPSNLGDDITANPGDWRLVTTLIAAGDISVTAEDRASIASTIYIEAIAKSANDGGASMLRHLLPSSPRPWRTSSASTRPGRTRALAPDSPPTPTSAAARRPTSTATPSPPPAT